MASRERNDIPWDQSLELGNVLNAPAVVRINEWKELGLELGVEKHVLDRIDRECRGLINDCKTEMFDCWLEDDLQASWEKVNRAVRTVSNRSHKSEWKESVRSLDTKTIGIAAIIVCSIFIFACGLLMGVFTLGFLIGTISIVGLVLVIFEKEEILKKIGEAVQLARNQRHQTEPSNMSENLIRDCVAKMDTKSVHAKDSPGAPAMRSVHAKDSPGAPAMKSVHAKDSPGAPSIKFVRATNCLEPNSLTRRKLRVGSTTDTSDMFCVYSFSQTANTFTPIYIGRGRFITCINTLDKLDRCLETDATETTEMLIIDTIPEHLKLIQNCCPRSLYACYETETFPRQLSLDCCPRSVTNTHDISARWFETDETFHLPTTDTVPEHPTLDCFPMSVTNTRDISAQCFVTNATEMFCPANSSSLMSANCTNLQCT